MANFSAYLLNFGATTYQAVLNSFVSVLEGYMTRFETLESGPWSANINAGGKKITGAADPTSAQDYATKAYADALAFTANAGILPGQGGNAGKYLKTNGTTASWAAILAGAVQAAADQAPTDDSNAVYWFSGTGDGLVVTLPAATSLSTGQRFILGNDSGFQGGILYNTGELLHVVPTGKGCLLELLDNSTTAGKWRVLDDINAATLANLQALKGNAATHATGNANSGVFDQAQIATDAFVMVYRATGTGFKMRAYSISGRTVTLGTEVSTGAMTPAQVRVIKTNTNSFTAFVSDGTTLTAYPCSLSGTTITVGTGVTLSSTLSNAAASNITFDASVVPSLGSNGCVAWIEAAGLKCSSFAQASGTASFSTQTSSAATALTGGIAVYGVGMPLSTANIAVVFFVDTHTGGLGTLKYSKITTLNSTPTVGALTTIGTAAGFNGTPGGNSAQFTQAPAAIPATDKVIYAFNDGGSGTSWKAQILDVGTATLGTAVALTTVTTVGSIIAESTTKAIWAGDNGTSIRVVNVTLSGNTISAQNVQAAGILGSAYTSSLSYQVARSTGLIPVDTNLYALGMRQTNGGTKELDLAILDTSGTLPVLKQRSQAVGPETLLYGPNTTLDAAGRNWVLQNSGYRGVAVYVDTSGSITGVETIQVSKKVS